MKHPRIERHAGFLYSQLFLAITSGSISWPSCQIRTRMAHYGQAYRHGALAAPPPCPYLRLMHYRHYQALQSCSVGQALVRACVQAHAG